MQEQTELYDIKSSGSSNENNSVKLVQMKKILFYNVSVFNSFFFLFLIGKYRFQLCPQNRFLKLNILKIRFKKKKKKKHSSLKKRVLFCLQITDFIVVSTQFQNMHKTFSDSKIVKAFQKCKKKKKAYIFCFQFSRLPRK